MSGMQLINDLGTIREYDIGEYTIRLYDHLYDLSNTTYTCGICKSDAVSILIYNDDCIVIYKICKPCNKPYDLFNKDLKKRKQGIALLKLKRLI